MEIEKHTQNGLNNPSLLTSIVTKYGEVTAARALVQLIPFLGGSLDTVFGEYSNRVYRDRIEAFLHDLQQRLSRLESVPTLDASPELFDFMRDAFEAVMRGKTAEKRAAISNIVCNQVIEPRPWDEANTATRILAGLEYSHLQILRAALDAPVVKEGGFEGARIVSLGHFLKAELMSNITVLPDIFTSMDKRLIENNVAELTSRSLLRDEGAGRYSTRPFTFFAATDLTVWFVGWIARDDFSASRLDTPNFR